MVDYSRFDNINSDDEVDEVVTPKITKPERPVEKMSTKGKDGRIRFEHNGQLIYEWEQSLTDVTIYIYPPTGVTRQMINCTISPAQLQVGLKGSPPFLNEKLGGVIVPDESTWTFLDGEIQIILQKMRKAEAWDCALQGAAGSKLDSYTQEEVKKKLMLERFQEENPGFDFSSAEFNGQVPNAREFMNGVKYG